MSMKIGAILRENPKAKIDVKKVHLKEYWKTDKETGELVAIDGMTKQGHADECDINKIIKKAGIQNAASHAAQYPAEYYQQFQDTDLLSAHNQVEKAREGFNALPSEVRSEFNNDPFAFIAFMNKPDNADRHEQVLRKLAQPGRQFANPVSRGAGGAGIATPAPVQTEQASPASDQQGASSGDSSPPASSST